MEQMAKKKQIDPVSAGGDFYINALQALGDGESDKAVISSAVKAISRGDMGVEDLKWILVASKERSNPDTFTKIKQVASEAYRNLGSRGLRDITRAVDFYKDPVGTYQKSIQDLLGEKLSYQKAPKYLIDAFGFVTNIFDGESDAKSE
jgi:hypothetical protein